MPIEIEAKLKVEDLDGIRARLKSLRALLIGDYLETNTFFDTSDRSLFQADRGLRLRVLHNLANGNEQVILTVKGPRLDGPLKRRQEHELIVASDADAAALLEALGFATVLTFEKKRQSWKLEDCKVELDQVPLLGCFVEIEGPAEASILRLRQRLGLDRAELIQPSYIALLTSHLQQHNIPERLITFNKQLADVSDKKES